MLFKIIYLTMSDEILYRYTQECVSAEYSLQSFAEWKSSQTNPNMLLACDFVFNILHPLFLFRAGIRQCNDDVSYAALYYASSLFYGFNHPKYREIIAKDIMFGICCPQAGSPVARRLGFRMSKSEYGQGLDFQLEERNKLQKNWVFSHGPPTVQQWIRASSSLSFFESIADAVKENVQWTLLSTKVWRPKFWKEYVAARQHFREVFANLGSNLHEFSEDKTPLNPKFANCSVSCFENMNSFMNAFVRGKKCILNIVSAEDLHNKSIDDLRKLAKRLLRGIPSAFKSDLDTRLKAAEEADDLIEIIGEIEYLVEGMASQFDKT